MRLFIACLIAIASVCAVHAQEAAKPAATVVHEETFDALDATDAWTPPAPWTTLRQKGVETMLAVGEDYGKDGKGLLFKNVKNPELKKDNVLSISLPLPGVTGKPIFTVAFDYRMPKGKDTGGRVDFGIYEGGAQKLFVITGGVVNFIYEEGKKEDGKAFATYARHVIKPDEWQHVVVEFDQVKQAYRVTVNDKVVPCGEGEWAQFRYNRPADPAKAKSLYFSCRANWPDAVRHIDNIRVTVPAAEE